MFGIPLEYLITYIVRMMTMAKPKPLTKEEKEAELKRLRDAQTKKNRVRGASNVGVNEEAAGIATEDPMDKKKGYAMGGMKKKGYAKGGPTKKKSAKKGAKKGGKVRGVGIAKKGFRPVKMR